MEFLGNLKVSQLKDQLAARNRETKGGKTVLINRLHALLLEEGTDPRVLSSSWNQIAFGQGTAHLRYIHWVHVPIIPLWPHQ